MNKLDHKARAQALQMMAEGISLRAIVRLTGISRLAERLREARANIRALSTPADEDDNGLAIAA